MFEGKYVFALDLLEGALDTELAEERLDVEAFAGAGWCAVPAPGCSDGSSPAFSGQHLISCS